LVLCLLIVVHYLNFKTKKILNKKKKINRKSKMPVISKVPQMRVEISEMIEELNIQNRELERYVEDLRVYKQNNELEDKVLLLINKGENLINNKVIVTNKVIIELGYQALALDDYEHFWKMAERISNVFSKVARGANDLGEFLDGLNLPDFF